MYDIKWIRDNLETFAEGLTRRGTPDDVRQQIIDEILSLDDARRAAITKFEQAQARRNAASKEIGEAKKAKDEARANALMAEVSELKENLSKLEADAKRLEEELNGPSGILATMPNTPLAEVPYGKDESDNVERHTFGSKRDYAFTPKQHFELGEALGMMDFELAAKLSGSRFVVLQKGLARMERALGQLFVDMHVDEHGYTEVNPPILVRDDVMFGTAQLPKFAEDQFETKIRRFLSSQFDLKSGVRSMITALDDIKFNDEHIRKEYDAARQNNRTANTSITFLGAGYAGDKGPIVSVDERLWLIPTAEVPLTNLVRDSIVAEDQLPMRLTACTPCFRAEAGAAGKDTRGMIRQHQFTKVELVSITTPEKAIEEHERMLACAEDVLKRLDLHYRVVTLCTGDMGFAAQKTYDIEVWLPGQNMYREISSCSVCGDFQARRMNARYRGADGKVKGPVHTLNGSGVAVGRALVAVLETYQQEDGSIAVPEALKPYMGGLTKVERA
jgi:seryl-tRNA synthetase